MDRSRSAACPEASYDRDIAEFGRRMEGLLAAAARFAVVDFLYYSFTDGDMAALVGVRVREARMAGDADATVGLTLDLPEPEAVVGRSPGLGATVVLGCGSVAGRHARITRAGGGYAIEDLASRNGTYVNGSPLAPDSPVPLANGDEVRFAHVLTFIFRSGPRPASGRPPAVHS